MRICWSMIPRSRGIGWSRSSRPPARAARAAIWVGQPGNFFGSTLVELAGTDPPAQSLSLAAGLALIEAVDAALPRLPLAPEMAQRSRPRRRQARRDPARTAGQPGRRRFRRQSRRRSGHPGTPGSPPRRPDLAAGVRPPACGKHEPDSDVVAHERARMTLPEPGSRERTRSELRSAFTARKGKPFAAGSTA
jgi:hypothetical protein